MRNAKTIRAVKLAARDGWAWPGGYPIVVAMHDGGCLCTGCARREFPRIARSTRDDLRDDWTAARVDIYMEGPEIRCDHCGAGIESAYGDPERR